MTIPDSFPIQFRDGDPVPAWLLHVEKGVLTKPLIFCADVQVGIDGEGYYVQPLYTKGAFISADSDGRVVLRGAPTCFKTEPLYSVKLSQAIKYAAES